VTVARPRQQQPAEAGKLNRKQYWQLKTAQSVRARYADGQPLTGKDLVYSLLRQHPRARAKLGAGVAAIVADRYICGSRCFFVVRQDGSAEDFSVPRCLGQNQPRSDRVRAMMARFSYDQVVRHFRPGGQHACSQGAA